MSQTPGTIAAMDRTERLFRIESLLRSRQIVPLETFLEALEVSRATFKRDLETLRDRFNAPIVWDRDAGGYRLDRAGAGPAFELPGLWFNATEIHALLTMQQLLQALQPGLLAPHVAPLRERLRALLDRSDLPAEAIEARIRIQRTAARTVEAAHFAPVAHALVTRRRLMLTHYNRARDEALARAVSPQRLTWYRDNWYLAAWCHLRDGLRSFALDALRAVRVLDEAALDLAPAELDAQLASGYGIFAGREVSWARLVFAAGRARWVAAETWHPAQRQTWLPDGALQLDLPYADATELTMDILRHVPHVRVLQPASLRERVLAALRAGLAAEDEPGPG